jgi:hypothetical protein
MIYLIVLLLVIKRCKTKGEVNKASGLYGIAVGLESVLEMRVSLGVGRDWALSS